MMKNRQLLIMSALLLVLIQAPCLHAQVGPRRPVTLLVQGIQMDLKKPLDVWGTPLAEPRNQVHWTGMIGYLESQGYRFGGIIRPKDGKPLTLPECLDRQSTVVDAKDADFFALEFAEVAQSEGLMARADELAAGIKALCDHTGHKKVRLVCHSAGGLAARLYLQGQIRTLPYRNDVDRLITIATPHLGSVLATYLGGLFLGERGDALSHTRPRIRVLNEEADLPQNVNYAAIIVRGFRRGGASAGADYRPLVRDLDLLNGLPREFREGGDEIVHVQSQNLRLASCARKYEEKTKKAVQYALAHVARANNADYCHNEALSSGNVQAWVNRFLSDDDSCWTGSWSTAERGQWVRAQAYPCALEIAEKSMEKLGATIQGDYIRRTTHFAGCNKDKDEWDFKLRFEGKWKSWYDGMAWVTGTQKLKCDPYGRILGCSFTPAEQKWVYTQDYFVEKTGEDFFQRASTHLNDGEYDLAINKFKKSIAEKHKEEEAADAVFQAYAKAAMVVVTCEDYELAANFMFEGLAALPARKLDEFLAAKAPQADRLAGISLSALCAAVHQHRGDLDSAIPLYKIAAKEAAGAAEDKKHLAPWMTVLLGRAYSLRGRTAYDKKQYRKAITDFDEVLKLSPKHFGALAFRGDALRLTGQATQAKQDIEKMITLFPTSHHGYHYMARLLSSCPDKTIRDADMSLQFAKTALDLSRGTDPAVFGVLAMAYAESGNYEKAVEWQKRVLADHAHMKSLPVATRAQLEKRLDDYRKQKPPRYEVFAGD